MDSGRDHRSFDRPKSGPLAPKPRQATDWDESSRGGEHINRLNAGFLVATHAAAFGALWTFTVPGLICFVCMVMSTLNLGLILCFHRLLSHRSFALPRRLELVLAFLGTCAAEAGPITWVAIHRKHHATADGRGDPHSPAVGWWWAYAGWTYHHFDVDLHKWAKDLCDDPAYRWLERWCLEIVLAVAVLICAAGYAIDGRRLALSFLFWGVFLRIVFTWQVSFLVNSFAHGAEPGPHGDRSRDVWWLGLLAFGDGWHYTHHRHPQSARQGYPWYRLDLAWVTIRILEMLGIATDVKRLRKL